jgi:ribonuclease P protein component
MTAARFTREHRLRRPAEYQRVFGSSTKSVDRSLVVLVFKRGDNQPPRLGLAISKKRVAKAVARNRIKRVIRESFRQHQDGLTGLDLVVLARNGVAKRSKRELFESMQHNLQRLMQP